MGIGDFFLKFSDAIKHGEAFAAHILTLVDKGVAIDEEIVAKAQAYSAMARRVIPGLEAGTATMTVPIDPAHAAALGVK